MTMARMMMKLDDQVITRPSHRRVGNRGNLVRGPRELPPLNLPSVRYAAFDKEHVSSEKICPLKCSISDPRQVKGGEFPRTPRNIPDPPVARSSRLPASP